MILYADRILAGDRTTVWEDRAVCVQDGAIRQIGSLAQLEQRLTGGGDLQP